MINTGDRFNLIIFGGKEGEKPWIFKTKTQPGENSTKKSSFPPE